MRVLTRSSHDDHDLGEVYECDGARVAHLIASGMVVPADEWTYRYVKPSGPTEDVRHLFTRVEKPAVTEVAPTPTTPEAEASAKEVAPAPAAPSAPEPETR